MINSLRFEVAIVKDSGFEEFYDLVSITTKDGASFQGLKENEVLLGLNNVTARLIDQAQKENKIVRIKKSIKGTEVLPMDLIISDANLNKLDDLKRLLTQSVRQEVTHQQALVSGILMYDFISINNKFIDKGYVITDENREEKYIEILETEDESLIDDLELYLNAKDVLSRASFLEKEYNEFYQEILTAETDTEVQEIYNEFIKKMNSLSDKQSIKTGRKDSDLIKNIDEEVPDEFEQSEQSE